MLISLIVRRIRGCLANAFVTVCSLLLLALCLEITARVAEDLRERGEQRQMSDSLPFSRFHPTLGWEKTPGSERRIRRDEFDIVIRVNSLGLRGPERDHAKPTGVRRILLLGDSFAAGYYVNEDDTLRAVLERRLNDGDSCAPAEVLNGGTIAYSTDQELLFYELEGRRYRPDAVVLMFYYNDLYYNASSSGPGGESKPFFEILSGEPVLRNVPLPEPSRPAGQQSCEVERRQPWRGSMALRWLANRTIDSSPRLYRRLSRWGLVPRASSSPPSELWVYGPSRKNVDMWHTTKNILARLKAEIAADGSRLIVLYVPARFEVNDEVWDLTRRRYRLGSRWRRTSVVYRLRGICSTLGVPLVDTSETMRESEAAGHPAYYSRDVHWNAEGNRLAALALESSVRKALDCAGDGSPTWGNEAES
ncbi:MAG: SGNH/GDSL hydrolase family protein [Vicinamibacteria bacterium]|nr:SGNH/GDSL hydrolase family protein [Vicinamibacteria bacterium]